jgi:transposase
MAPEFQVVHPHAAGIDIGSRQFFVSAKESHYEIFNTYTEGCYAVRDYLKAEGVTSVAMESTGVYWITLYDVLDSAGFEVYLVNGREAKNMPGRKSDIKDCQWLRQLHTYGLLRRSFIPDEAIRKLRSYVRLRRDNIRAQASQTNLIQKALTLMNIRLTEVINDVMGVSGKRMIEAILAGERNIDKIVSLCHETILSKKEDQVKKALEGNYKEEHMFALKQAYNTWMYYAGQIKECDYEMQKLLNERTQDLPPVENMQKRKPIRYNKPDIDNLPQMILKLTDGKDPVGIPGITDYSLLQLISEVGTDMSHWPNEKKFVSWLKLAPMSNQSGKINKRISAKRSNKASLIIRTIAQGIVTSKKIAMGAFARRIRAKRGSAVAIKAVARKIACYFYRVMTKGTAFVEKGIEMYELDQKERAKQHILKMAKKYNLNLSAGI